MYKIAGALVNIYTLVDSRRARVIEEPHRSLEGWEEETYGDDYLCTVKHVYSWRAKSGQDMNVLITQDYYKCGHWYSWHPWWAPVESYVEIPSLGSNGHVDKV